MPISPANERIVLILPRSLVQAIREHQRTGGDRKKVGPYVREQLPGWLKDAGQLQRHDALAAHVIRLAEVVTVQVRQMQALAAGVDALRDELQIKRADEAGVP